MAIVEVAHLHEQYGATVAVQDVSFIVAEGEMFGLLGPNGAGRTTTVESIVGLRVPDAGTIRVFGLDPLVDHAASRERVGVQLQESALPPKLRVGEVLTLYSSTPLVFFAGVWLPREVMPPPSGPSVTSRGWVPPSTPWTSRC